MSKSLGNYFSSFELLQQQESPEVKQARANAMEETKKLANLVNPPVDCKNSQSMMNNPFPFMPSLLYPEFDPRMRSRGEAELSNKPSCFVADACVTNDDCNMQKCCDVSQDAKGLGEFPFFTNGKTIMNAPCGDTNSAKRVCQNSICKSSLY